MPDPLLDILGEPENKVSATSPKEVSLDDIFGEPELKKKEPSEVGSEVGGLSTTQVQDSSLDGGEGGLFDKLAAAIDERPVSSGYERILKSGKIPENPFEKAALGQLPIDKEIEVTPDGKPKEETAAPQTESLYDLALTDTEKWYGAAPSPRKKIASFNEEAKAIQSKYQSQIDNGLDVDENAYNTELSELANRLGLTWENGDVKVSQGEIDKYQEVYSRKLNERLSRLSEAKKNPYIKDVINKLGAGSAGVLNTPYNAMALSEKAGNALLGLVGVEPSTYWQDFATYLNSNKNELSANSQRYEEDIVSLVQNGDMGAAIGKAGLDFAETLPMLITLIMGNAAGATKATLGFMGGSKSAEEYMSLNNRDDIGEFSKIIDALGVGVSEILFEKTGTVKILNGIKKGIQEKGQNIVRDELVKMLQTNMQRNISLLMQGNSDMVREGVSEAMTQLADNLIKKATVDPNIDIWEGVTDSAIVGGLIGKGINLSLNAANHIQTKGTRKAVTEAIKQVPQNYSLEAKEKIATLTLEKQAIQDKTKDAAKPIQEIVSPQIKAIDEEIKKIAAKEEGIELPVEEKPKESEKKKPEVKIPESEVKISPEGITSLKEEKTTERPKEEKPVEKEAAPHEKAYEESIAKKSEEDLAKMPTYSGKKFSLATILPNGDISNVYVRSEGQSHKTYMSPEDATAYEEGRMTLGYWSPAEQKFMEAPQKGKEFGQKVMDIAASKVKIPEVETKITEEPSYAERIPKIEGQVSPGGDAIKEGEGEGGQNLEQQEPEQPGDEKKGLTYSEMETQLDELNTSINKMKEENANEFKKDGTIKAKSKLFGSYRALNDMRSGLLEQMQGSYQEEFTKRAREESEKSRLETEQINKAFEERQQELKKNIPPEELKEIETDNEVQRIFDKTSGNEVPTQEEINFVNENAYLPKGFEFGEKGLQKVKEKEPSQPEIEPEVAKKLRSVANKIREGKISRIQGFKADTPFTLAWDGGLEVLATTLEATADLTVAIDNALTHIKNTEWYKNLTKDRQVEFDKKFEEHIDKELGDEYRDATKHKFVNKDVEERFNQAVIHPKTFMDKAKEAFTDLRDKILRTYKDLPKNKRFAEAYNAINQFQKGVEISSSKAGDIITRILGKMSKPDYELFTKKIIFDDLLETIKMNPVYELPYGLTEETLKQELDNINKFVAFNAKVKDAIKKRKEVYKEVQSEYVDYANKIGVKTDGYFERNDYFRHQVLLYSEASKGTIERKGSPLSRPKKLSLFKERVQGRGLDINRNYIESEFEVFNKLLYAIEKMKMIDNIYRNYDIMKDLKAKAKEELGEEATRAEINRWIEDNIPDGYVIDSPENMNIFMAQSVPESLVQDLLLGNVEEMGIKRDDLRKIFALGAAKKIVIPTEIYKTMDNISRVNDKDRFAQFSKKLLTGWKIWTLIQPKRFFKYNIRNLTGDSEAVFLGNPRVFKKTLASARELYDVFVSKDIPSPDMNEYISRGGLQLVLTTQEIGELRKVKEFEKYYDNKRNLLSKAWDGYWKTAKLTTDFREQLLRYAAYKEWLSEIDKNNGKVKNYGASNREFIDGLESKYDKAFRLSNELLGAYDQISEAGQNLRSYWIPFWSFQEINFRRTNQMFLNALDSEKSLSGKSLKGIEFAAKKVPFIAWKATKLSIKLSGFWAMTAVWNGLLFGDEEDELPEEIKSKPHIVFGRNPDGTIRYLSRLGVMGDYLEWFGMDSMPMYINEWLAGRMSTSDIAKDMVLSAPNKLVNGVNPYVKTTAELIFRKSLFPDISNPRAIRDYGEQIAINLGLKDEYRAISKLPDQPYYKSLRKMFWDEIDPLATAYWNISSYKADFKKKQGKDEKGSYTFTDKSLALYYYKQALMYGDTNSAEYHLERYIMLGGTKRGYNTSMGYLDPMRGIKAEEKEEFIKFLGKENEHLLDQAMEYYKKVLDSKMEWPDDKLEDEEPKDLEPIEISQ